MTKKIKTILFSSVLLAISVILLLVFFVFLKPQKDNLPLSILASDISLNKNETVSNFYTLSHEDATLEFVVSKENVVEINKDYIKGINAGVVKVTIIAKLDDSQAEATFTVSVYESGYTFSVITLDNCSFSDSTLTIQSFPCQFRVEVYDRLGQTVDSPFTYSANNGANLTMQFNTFLLTASDNCQVQISYSEINFIATIDVEIQ